jgi:hypothetical protein
LVEEAGYHIKARDAQLFEMERQARNVAKPSPIKAPGNDQLSKLWNAIVENTQGDGFWIGEILLTTLEREVGLNPAGLTNPSTDRQSIPPDWKQDQAETSRLPRPSQERKTT